MRCLRVVGSPSPIQRMIASVVAYETGLITPGSARAS
jgi:hypothetical protein